MRAVKRLSKAILFVGGGLAVFAAGTLIALSLYLKSSSVQAQIQDALADALGLPVKFASTSLTPWSDLEINGIHIAQPGGVEGEFIEAESISASYELLPLFRKELVISRMTLDAPKLVWRQNEEGQWEWPNAKKGEKKPKVKGEKKLRVKKPKGTRLAGQSKSGFRVLIDDVAVRQGTIQLLDAQGLPVVSGIGVNIDLDEFEPPYFGGTLRAGKIEWAGLTFETVATPFTFDDGALDLSALAGQLADGTANGSFQLDTEDEGSPLSAKLTVRKAQLGNLVIAWGWTDGAVSGLLSGEIELHGTLKKFARSEGKGHLSLEDGHFQKLELFETIGQVLGLDELANMHFSEATAELRMADEKVFVEPVVLATPDLRLTAKGAVKLDTKVSLDARLAVDEKLAKRLPSFVRDNFVATETDPMRGIDFKVTGKTSKPKTDLAEKLIGKKVGEQVSDLIGGLFGTKKKKKDADKPVVPESAKPADAPISTIEPPAPKDPAPQP